ncbi:TPA: hypothetical protein N0F65_008191, partial [Lagenidium giganteum]
EKRERILKIYHENKEVYNIKEIEKIGSKAGVVLQTIKDVNQALVDDALVDFDKIGSGNYFWSFPSKVSQQRKRKLEDLQGRKATLEGKLKHVKATIDAQKNQRTESEERVEKLKRMNELQSNVNDMKTRIQHLAENDPEVLEKLDKQVKTAKEGADRWTDNIFTLRSWIVQKRGCANAEVRRAVLSLTRELQVTGLFVGVATLGQQVDWHQRRV